MKHSKKEIKTLIDTNNMDDCEIINLDNNQSKIIIILSKKEAPMKQNKGMTIEDLAIKMDSRFDKIDSRLDKIEKDVVEIKSDIVEIKSDIVEIKSDIVEINSDIALIKDLPTIHKELQLIK